MIVANGFPQISNAIFVNLPVAGLPGYLVPTLTAGGITITFTFSVPVAAFGATFNYSSALPGFETPDEIQLFDSPNGAGALRASIRSSDAGGGSSDVSLSACGARQQIFDRL